MKKILVVGLIIVVIILSAFGYIKYKDYYSRKKKNQEQNRLIKEINNNFNKNMITINDSTLYVYSNNKYNKKGEISKNYILELEKLDNNDPYYKITNTNYYISFKDVKKYDKELTNDNRYNYFIPFDNNVIVNNKPIYLDDGSNICIDEEINEPLIIKDNDKYGFIYMNKLFYVNKEDASIIEIKHDDRKKAKKVLTLTYHFIYDPEEESCNQSICQTISQFENHLKYLKDNDYFVMRLPELEMYLDGKINVPYNSIVLTIDDGYISNKAIKLLEQYETYATLFVITGHFDDFSKFYSPYLDLQSHTDGMHKQYACKGMGNQGGGLLCAKEDDAIADLQLSQKKLGGVDKIVYLSYPFFDFNDHAIDILKKAGFKMAFIGQWNVKGFSTVGTNKYKVPRLTVFSDTTVEKLKQALIY